MDPVLLSQLTYVVSGLADGALGEAGKEAWEALAGVVRRLARRESGPILPEAGHDGGPIDVAGLLTALTREADANPEFAKALQDWQLATGRLVREQGNVNVISGTVHGPSVQARDIHGSISFGTPGPANNGPGEEGAG
jgi:hypothetical protein